DASVTSRSEPVGGSQSEVTTFSAPATSLANLIETHWAVVASSWRSTAPSLIPTTPVRLMAVTATVMRASTASPISASSRVKPAAPPPRPSSLPTPRSLSAGGREASAEPSGAGHPGRRGAGHPSRLGGRRGRRRRRRRRRLGPGRAVVARVRLGSGLHHVLEVGADGHPDGAGSEL